MYLSITGATPDNKLAKYQSFELEADANAHSIEYNGFAVQDIGGNQEFWIVDMVAKTVTQDTATEATVTTERAWSELRTKRDQLLNNTDWWASSDLSITEAQTSYRQQLRDLPANTADPADPTWPTQPE